MTGVEWVVEAYGCDPESLSSLAKLQALFARLVQELSLHPCGQDQWRQFPDSGGITGLCLLSESHLTCHTFPEHGSLCLNLFCCRPRADWDFTARLKEMFAAETVSVRRLERPYSAPSDMAAAAAHSITGGLRAGD